VTLRARSADESKPQGGVRFRTSSARKESSGERERGSRPCGAAVRGYVPRASLRRNPKEVADHLRFVVVYFRREGKQSEVIQVGDNDFGRELTDSVRSE
jgi:hypothetical protein